MSLPRPCLDFYRLHLQNHSLAWIIKYHQFFIVHKAARMITITGSRSFLVSFPDNPYPSNTTISISPVHAAHVLQNILCSEIHTAHICHPGIPFSYNPNDTILPVLFPLNLKCRSQITGFILRILHQPGSKISVLLLLPALHWKKWTDVRRPETCRSLPLFFRIWLHIHPVYPVLPFRPQSSPKARPSKLSTAWLNSVRHLFAIK